MSQTPTWERLPVDKPAARSRSGFSLMEVLLATAILLGSTIVLVELASIGRHHANSAAQLAMAQRLCENKINEILAGVAPLESVESQPLETNAFNDLLSVGESMATDPMWLYSVEMVSLDQPALVSVRVTVWPATESDEDRRNAFSLVRWMRSPYQNEAEPVRQPVLGSSAYGTAILSCPPVALKPSSPFDLIADISNGRRHIDESILREGPSL